jgi:phage shock protein PspC (stress-responsive transcriptional regulator)
MTATTKRPTNRNANNRSRLTRHALDRVLGGVCGGLSATLGVNAWWARIAFAALVLVQPSFGILLYILLWVALPAQTLSDLPIPAGGTKRPRPESILLIGILLIIAGVLTLAGNLEILRGVRVDLLTPVMLLLIGLILLLRQLRRN